MTTLLDRLFGWTPIVEAAATTDVPVGTAATSEGTLAELDPAAAYAFGVTTDGGPVTRAAAMRVPGIRRGRNLIAATIGTLPLVAVQRQDGAEQQVSRPLVDQLDPRTTRAYTLTWTVDDLIFYPVAWWRVTARDYRQYPTAVERLTRDRVQVQPATATRMGRVLVDGREVDDRDVIRFDSPDGGLLADGADIIRLALALTRAGQRIADDDWSGLVLRLVEGATELSTKPGTASDGSTRSQVDELLDTWEAARRLRTTAYLNGAVTADSVGLNAQDRQLTELSQLVASETARLLNLPPSRIGAPQGSGMTYTNTEADRRDLVDTTLAPYLSAIAQRLSMPDVTPGGHSVGFDLTAYLRGTVTELVSAGAAAIDAGMTDAPEVRTRWLGLPARSDLTTPNREDNPA